MPKTKKRNNLKGFAAKAIRQLINKWYNKIVLKMYSVLKSANFLIFATQAKNIYDVTGVFRTNKVTAN